MIFKIHRSIKYFKDQFFRHFDYIRHHENLYADDIICTNSSILNTKPNI